MIATNCVLSGRGAIGLETDLDLTITASQYALSWLGHGGLKQDTVSAPFRIPATPLAIIPRTCQSGLTFKGDLSERRSPEFEPSSAYFWNSLAVTGGKLHGLFAKWHRWQSTFTCVTCGKNDA